MSRDTETYSPALSAPSKRSFCKILSTYGLIQRPPTQDSIKRLMTDTLTVAARSERMSRIRSKNTKPEMLVRRLIHAMGYRYRLHGRDLPGAPDVVFAGIRKAILVHSCFWHRHPDSQCRLARLPKSRVDFWEDKLNGNRRRDEANEARLCAMGWDVLVIWECIIKSNVYQKIKIADFLELKVEA